MHLECALCLTWPDMPRGEELTDAKIAELRDSEEYRRALEEAYEALGLPPSLRRWGALRRR